MRRIRKSVLEAKELGDALRGRRKALGLTLGQLAGLLGVDVGQLSRFERAEFKYVSKNLQKTADYLQIPTAAATLEAQDADAVVGKFVELLRRSERHRAAAIALIEALQDLR
ncbi:helix-turn-helix transcriptional regulator [Burkholderia pseudomallei]|nr:helix-turn-helix transcriptional regulator [Burkholderia pseudomallei]